MQYHQVPLQTLIRDHREKAIQFLRRASNCLANTELANICSFYAAYHAMRYAILSDPLFQQPTAQIQQIKGLGKLHADDRFNTHHSARFGSNNGPGQNEIIARIYPSWYQRYEELHKVSIDARYLDYSGQQLIDAHTAYTYATQIKEEALAGNITWSC